MSAVPVAGRVGIIKIGASAIGKVRNIRANLAVKAIKDYSMDDVAPEVLQPGEETYTFSVEKLWVGATYATAVLGQAAAGVTISIFPSGSPAGATKAVATLTGVQFTRWQLTEDKDGVAAENIEGEAKALTFVPP